jgi:uncharacterized protein YbjT (DUF2867 family)
LPIDALIDIKVGAGKAVCKDTAFEVFAQRLAHIGFGGAVLALFIELACTGKVEPSLVVPGYRLAWQRALRMARFVEFGRDLKRLFLMRPPAIGNVERWVFSLLDAAMNAGIERIVFLSIASAERRAYLPHAKIEARLALLARRTELKVGILRPGFFTQNQLTAYQEDIKHDDRLYVCAAAGNTHGRCHRAPR